MATQTPQVLHCLLEQGAQWDKLTNLRSFLIELGRTDAAGEHRLKPEDHEAGSLTEIESLFDVLGDLKNIPDDEMRAKLERIDPHEMLNHQACEGMSDAALDSPLKTIFDTGKTRYLKLVEGECEFFDEPDNGAVETVHALLALRRFAFEMSPSDKLATVGGRRLLKFMWTIIHQTAHHALTGGFECRVPIFHLQDSASMIREVFVKTPSIRVLIKSAIACAFRNKAHYWPGNRPKSDTDYYRYGTNRPGIEARGAAMTWILILSALAGSKQQLRFDTPGVIERAGRGSRVAFRGNYGDNPATDDLIEPTELCCLVQLEEKRYYATGNLQLSNSLRVLSAVMARMLGLHMVGELAGFEAPDYVRSLVVFGVHYSVVDIVDPCTDKFF